jgi:hypothetical protein
MTVFDFARRASDYPDRHTINVADWHGWELKGSELVFPAYRHGCYPVNLERVGGSSARMLDWIMQVQGKMWATPECVAGLVAAFNDIFHPQATLCSGGGDHWVSAKEVRQRIAEARKELKRKHRA